MRSASMPPVLLCVKKAVLVPADRMRYAGEHATGHAPCGMAAKQRRVLLPGLDRHVLITWLAANKVFGFNLSLCVVKPAPTCRSVRVDS